MHVAVSKLILQLPENQSLKGKRRVVNSLSSKLRSKFNVTVGEVSNEDAWGTTTLGIAYVSNSKRHAGEVMSSVLGFIDTSRNDTYLIDHDIEILSGF